jgi:hypothetical protein
MMELANIFGGLNFFCQLIAAIRNYDRPVSGVLRCGYCGVMLAYLLLDMRILSEYLLVLHDHWLA